MKHLKPLACRLIVCSFIAFTVASCSSDPNPVNFIKTTGEKAFVTLDLSVEATRAEDSNATTEETNVSKVSVYIFGDDDKLEKIHTDLTVTDNKIDKLETTSGLKTIYAVAAGSVAEVTEGTTTLSDFETAKIPSTIDKLKTSSGFLMIGKSEKRKVVKSSTQNAMPASNSFAIQLTRAAAKAQVIESSSLNSNSADIGFRITISHFAIRQTANSFQLTPNETDFQTFTDEGGNGTYDCYTISSAESNDGFIAAQNTLSPDKCVYMPENIVENPVTGNTTYLSVKVIMSPEQRYSFASGASKPTIDESKKNQGATTYYVVGIIDTENGFADYTIGEDNKVMCFHAEDDADRYRDALNGGSLSAFTVSDTDEAMKMPRHTRAANLTYKTVTFAAAEAYYRINIAKSEGESKKYRVDRNTFYKITVNSVKTLGFPSEDMLRPTNPETSLELNPSTWLDASFDIVPWNNVEQNVDL